MKCELTYQETLDIIERFMINSGIREYCTEICKGSCCMDCYNNPNACRHHEGRRLPCSIYTCYGLKNRLPAKIVKILIKVGQDIHIEYYKYDCKHDLYFDVPSKSFMKTVRFPISIKKRLGEIDVEKIKNIMICLIESKKIIYMR